MDRSELEDKVEVAQNKCEKIIEDIADEYRAEVIVPFCKKHHLKFLSGNGTWFFVAVRADKILYPWVFTGWQEGKPCELADTIEKIDEDLRLVVVDRQLGWYVLSYHP